MNALWELEIKLANGHVWPEPKCEHLGDNLGNGMNKADGSEVGDAFRAILLRQKHNVGRVDPVKVGTLEWPKVVNHAHGILLDNLPAVFEKHPGPGALSLGIWLMAVLTSSSVKGFPRLVKSTSGKSKLSQLKSFSFLPPPPKVSEKCSAMISSFWAWSVIQPLLCFRRWMWFFLLRAFTLRWKNFVLASPSFKFLILEHCFFPRALNDREANNPSLETRTE